MRYTAVIQFVLALIVFVHVSHKEVNFVHFSMNLIFRCNELLFVKDMSCFCYNTIFVHNKKSFQAYNNV